MQADDINIRFEGKSHVQLARGERLHPRIDHSRGQSISSASEGRISKQVGRLCIDMQYCSSLVLLFGPLFGYFLRGGFTRVKSIELAPSDILNLVICQVEGKPMYHLYVKCPKGITGKPLTEVIVFTPWKEENRDAVHSMLLASVSKDKISEGQ